VVIQNTVYKIFPDRDATLYSAYPNMNTGDDAILEVSNLNPALQHSPRVARALIDFRQEEIQNIIDTKISSSVGGLGEEEWVAYLKLYIAEASGLNHDVDLEVALVSGSWQNGSGQYNDKPQSQNGVSWNWLDYSGSNAWNTPGGDIRDVSSLNQEFTQSFDSRNIRDINIEIRDLVDILRGEDAVVQYGNLLSVGQDTIMVKLSGSAEFKSGSAHQPQIKFFSVDTNTIYPPQLEFRWNDFVYETGSLNEIDTSDIFLSIDNNPGTFYSSSVNRFKVNVRPEFPVRTFKTSSVHTINHYLPTASYYAIKDLDTNEYVIDFDKKYTKISCDSDGNYFDVYMNGLQPERYYKILLQTTISGSTIVKDEDYIFKVVNG